MSIYPKIPNLSVLVDRVRLTLKPVLSSSPNPELRIQVRVGLTGDVVTHGYYIGLHDEVQRNKLNLTDDDLDHITRMYYHRIRIRLEMEAIVRNSNLWWMNIGLKLRPEAMNYVMRRLPDDWEKMAVGYVPEDELYIEVIHGDDGFLAYRQDHYSSRAPVPEAEDGTAIN